jgi:predicted nucleic acid-binding protein
LWDTNVFSELVKTKPDDMVVKWLRDNEPELYISTITIGEIRRGIEGLPVGKRKASLQSWLTGLCNRMEGRILSFNTNVAHVWVRWSLAAIRAPSLSPPSIANLLPQPIVTG